MEPPAPTNGDALFAIMLFLALGPPLLLANIHCCFPSLADKIDKYCESIMYPDKFPNKRTLVTLVFERVNDKPVITLDFRGNADDDPTSQKRVADAIRGKLALWRDVRFRAHGLAG